MSEDCIAAEAIARQMLLLPKGAPHRNRPGVVSDSEAEILTERRSVVVGFQGTAHVGRSVHRHGQARLAVAESMIEEPALALRAPVCFMAALGGVSSGSNNLSLIIQAMSNGKRARYNSQILVITFRARFGGVDGSRMPG